MINNLPANTVERLSLYRRVLLNYPVEKKPYIHSHQLAHIIKINPAHIRRDLMLIGFTGDIHKGYYIPEMITEIGKAIDCTRTLKVAFIGIGDLGRTVAEYFNHDDSKIKIAATFRFDKEPENQFPDVKCYNVSKINNVIKQKNIELAVVAVPPEFAESISKKLVKAGIKGILNFTSVHLQVPEEVYVENYDMINKLEKLAYFTNKDSCPSE